MATERVNQFKREQYEFLEAIRQMKPAGLDFRFHSPSSKTHRHLVWAPSGHSGISFDFTARKNDAEARLEICVRTDPEKYPRNQRVLDLLSQDEIRAMAPRSYEIDGDKVMIKLDKWLGTSDTQKHQLQRDMAQALQAFIRKFGKMIEGVL